MSHVERTIWADGSLVWKISDANPPAFVAQSLLPEVDCLKSTTGTGGARRLERTACLADPGSDFGWYHRRLPKSFENEGHRFTRGVAEPADFATLQTGDRKTVQIGDAVGGRAGDTLLT